MGTSGRGQFNLQVEAHAAQVGWRPQAAPSSEGSAGSVAPVAGGRRRSQRGAAPSGPARARAAPVARAGGAGQALEQGAESRPGACSEDAPAPARSWRVHQMNRH